MQKTLLDEFAMAALSGLLANYAYDADEAAAKAFERAEAMMAERVKRMPAPPVAQEVDHTYQADLDTAKWLSPPENLAAAIASFKGRKVTCSEICQKAYNWAGDMTALREIGATLRGMGYQKVRSGGKDYYQL